MSQAPHLNELGEFLKARRAELSPGAVGLPDRDGPRRAGGLRRKEVARLAAISTDYYTRMEQGRIPASGPVLAAVADVLRLDEEQRRHLFRLAGKDTVRPRRRARDTVRPPLRRILADLLFSPAVVLGRRMDVLAWNALAAALVTDFGAVPEKRRNYVRLLFTDPALRTLHADWPGAARAAVAQLRTAAVTHPDDRRLAALVGELSVRDADFRQWWADGHLVAPAGGAVVLRHPVAGELALDQEVLTAVGDPAQRLVVWTAEAGTPAYDGLRILASWTADRPSPGDGPGRA
ncbi:helix-turn-helix domain-containing protein [Streptomyces sp. NPDC057682]|uniref:helix-turn-helix domain-containing protein n=1 Tax=unclassified Streptomyces TaxID=2593676 RepID=UPI00364B22D3